MNRSLSILIVDDDADNASSLAELFELDGHLVTTVHSGEDAISAYLKQSYDLAFMDVVMPGKNGVESFMEIKKLKPTARVVMMTGYSVEQLLQQAIENGALGVLAKPMDPAKILSLVKEVGPEGIVVAQSDSGATAKRMESIFASAGRSCKLFNKAPDISNAQGHANGDIHIFDLHSSLIEGVAHCKNLRMAGARAPAIILTDSDSDSGDPGDVLRDFRSTGILNKPFDPDQLLNRLHILAA